MSKFIKIIIFWLLAILLLSSIYKFANNIKIHKSKNEKLSILVEKVRLHDVHEKLKEVKRVGTSPQWIKDSISQLILYLSENKDENGNPLTNSQILEVFNAFGSSGKESSPATSAIIKILLNNSNIEVFKVGLLSLVRIHSQKESLEDIFNLECRDDNSERCHFAKILKLRFDDSEKKSAKNNDLSNFINDKILKIHDFNSWDGDIKRKLYEASLLGDLDIDTINNICKLIKVVENKEVKLSLINLLSDQKESIEANVNCLSYTMQYDSNLSVREAAFIALRRIGTDLSLSLIHAYGHKLINGEVAPKEEANNPFITWAINNAKNINK